MNKKSLARRRRIALRDEMDAVVAEAMALYKRPADVAIHIRTNLRLRGIVLRWESGMAPDESALQYREGARYPSFEIE